jgi:hypothetical protein
MLISPLKYHLSYISLNSLTTKIIVGRGNLTRFSLLILVLFVDLCAALSDAMTIADQECVMDVSEELGLK